MSIWLTIILFVVALIVLFVWELLAARIERVWVRALGTVVAASLVMPTAFSLIQYAVTAHEREQAAADRKEESEFREAVTRALADKGTAPERLEDLLRFRYREVYEKAGEESAEWIKDLLSSLPAKREQLARLNQGDQELAGQLEARWKPLYEFVLKSLDSKLTALADQGLVRITSTPSEPLLAGGRNGWKMFELRKLGVKDGTYLVVRMNQGFVEGGRVARAPILRFDEINSNNVDFVFGLEFEAGFVNFTSEEFEHSNKGFAAVQLQDDLLSPENRKLIEDAIRFTVQKLVVRAG